MDARLETLYRMQPMSAAETDTLFTEVFAGSMSEPELASLLTALKMKGETLDEIRGAAAAMLRAARPFPKSAFEVGEIVGTGGDGAGTINVSTMTALAAAGAGLRIAKHGNRGVSSPSGASSPSPASAPTPTSSASHARPASSSWAPSSIRPTTSRSPRRPAGSRGFSSGDSPKGSSSTAPRTASRADSRPKTHGPPQLRVRRGSTRTRASSRRRASRIRAFWPSSRAPCGDAPDADPKTEHTELHRTELEKGISIMLLNPYFGQYGGQFVPELLLPALDQLERAYVDATNDPAFRTELDRLLTTYAGRPTPLTRLTRLTEGTKTTIYLKREDLLHGGAHKTNQVLGQALLTKRMGKTRVIAETGAGQHGVATALASALFGFTCRIYMGAKDVERQKPNVFRMELMGAEVVPVTAGSGTLKEACNAALRNWAESFEDTHYMLGTAAGPHPFPTIVREFQKVIGEEARAQFAEAENGLLPDAVIACVGGGSNAIGLFTDFRPFEDTRLIGVEPAGMGIASGKHGVTLGEGQLGIFFGARSYNMQTPEGQINESYSISAGLDFPSVDPEHAHLKYTGRAEYVSVTDREALGAFLELSLKEGIIPALESSHALAYALKMARAEPEKEQKLVVNLSGRGDKDIFQVAARLEADGCLKDGRLSSDALGAYAD